MFAQMFSGLTHIYLEAVLFLGLLIVLIFKPERIRRPAHFWKGCLFLVASVVVPALLSLLIGAGDMNDFPFGGSFWTRLLGLVGPALFAISFLLIAFSLFPASPGCRCWPFPKDDEKQAD